jgi:hypothetical protein
MFFAQKCFNADEYLWNQLFCSLYEIC